MGQAAVEEPAQGLGAHGKVTTKGSVGTLDAGKRLAMRLPGWGLASAVAEWVWGARSAKQAAGKEGIGIREGASRRSKGETQSQISMWYKKMESATCYEEWLDAASTLDELEGSNTWKAEDESPYYDSELIRQRLQEMQRSCAEQDMPAIIASLRSGLVRNLGGIGDPRLHDETHVGTKNLIRKHQTVLTRLLWEIANAPQDVIPLEKRLEFFTESRHALGKTALMLSGGASLGMYHFGILKALSAQKLLPRVISGSSAGAIVAAIVGVRTNEEMAELFDDTSRIRLEFFGNPVGSLERKLKRIFQTGHLMDVSKLQKVLIDNIGHVTFHEAYERTGRIINITVSPGNSFEKPRILNYLTSPNVLMWSAASASCALPGLFEAVELLCKNAEGEHVPYHISNVTWTDGSLQSDLPTARLQELFNINYFIVSQTNPHAIPFVQKAQRDIAKRPKHRTQPSITQRLASAALYMVKSEILHRCSQGIQLGIVPSFLGGLLNQKYVGDVTIVPPLSLSGYARVISNPTSSSLAEFVRIGEKRTWPSIALIRSQCELEIVLDQCVRKLAAEAQRQAAMGAPVETSPGRRRARHTHLDLNNFFGTSSVLHGSAADNMTGFQADVVQNIIAQDEHEEQAETHGEHANPGGADIAHMDVHELQTEDFVTMMRHGSADSLGSEGSGRGGKAAR
mmetsp:Transcript_28388/g.66348  ORF Transcript_28388/g.66348 Transcript_28388/m.66348 type:complete len:683 (+) Transcript_28388:196-2244(+)